MCDITSDPSMHDKPKPWGEVWGAPFVRTSDGTIVVMRRKGQRVQFFDHHGEPVGPEHRNVAPALIWAWSDQSGLSDPSLEPWIADGIRRELALNRKEH